MRERFAGAVLLGLVTVASCAKHGAATDDRPVAVTADGAVPGAPRVPFEVRADATELLFFWFDERGASHSASRFDDVPQARRGVVRVDPSRPEQRAPGWVYLADLRTPSARGTFPVRAVRSEDLSQQLMAMAGVQGPLGSQPPAQPAQPAQPSRPGASAQPSTSGVILYGASWCSACHQAAAWFRAHNVAFVEKDIEQDATAQQEMMDKARRAGVPTGSIPIIDVRGHILLGFSPPDLERALAGT